MTHSWTNPPPSTSFDGLGLNPPLDDKPLIGDVVWLRGQGQLMTIEDVCDCGSASVVWFAGNDEDGWTLHRDTFDLNMLDGLDDD